MKRPALVNNEIYHVYNRGVEKRKTFLDDNDYFRFIHDLFEFNDTNPTSKFYIPSAATAQFSEVGLPKIEPKRGREPRKLMIELMAFCLMPNHFHLMVRQKQEKGVSEFMRKLGTGYTNYFNQKYERVGPLFQGKFKAARLKSQANFINLPYYIHMNPLDLIESEWREKGIKNYEKSIRFLENYRWSSFQDYIGRKNFPSVTQREFLLNFFEKPELYKKESMVWLKEFDPETIKSVVIE